MKSEGHDIVSFAAGEPDFNTPEEICQSAIQAIESGFTKYTPSAGIPELREKVCEKLARENGIRVEPSQVVISCGAKHSVYNTMMVLLEPGDEVLLIAPYWMTYADQVRLAGGVPVVVQTRAEDGFVPSVDALREKITAKTRAIVVNSPSNPTGAVFGRETLKQIAALALRHDLYVVADEIYEKLLYDQNHTSIASLGREVASRTITIGGCSKTYAMTGWRVGFAAAPLEIAKAMSNFQDQVTSNPTSFAQRGAVAAYGMSDEQIAAMREEFRARRDLIVALLGEIPGVTTPVPGGAFYVFPSFAGYLGREVADDVALAQFLLENAKAATVPGSVFEGPGHLRLSYACSRADIEKGISRIAEALAPLCP